MRFEKCCEVRSLERETEEGQEKKMLYHILYYFAYKMLLIIYVYFYMCLPTKVCYNQLYISNTPPQIGSFVNSQFAKEIMMSRALERLGQDVS